MHDIDRTVREFESGELFEFESLGEFANENEYSHEFGHEYERPVFDEVQEMEFAAELLEITNEQELEQFLGKLIKGAGKAIGGFVKSPVGQQLGGMLKGVARKALPMVGKALGNMVVPGVGGVIGGKLGSMASSLFELELEGLSAEDREFEVARQYVRLAGAAAQNAAQAPSNAAPSTIARTALATAARQYAPGLARALQGGGAPGRGASNGRGGDQPNANGDSSRKRSGRWIRRGSNIVILMGE